MRFLSLLIALTAMACALKRNNDVQQTAGADSLQISSTELTDSWSEVEEPGDSTDFETLGFELMNSETIGQFKVGMEVSSLIELLGQPAEKLERVLWEGDGEYHQTIKYPEQGLEFDMIGESDQKQTVNRISMDAPCKFITSKGVGVGSSYAQVAQLYKAFLNPAFSDSDVLVAGSIYGGVIFSFEEGVLRSVFIGAEAE